MMPSKPSLSPFAHELARFLNYALGKSRWGATIKPAAFQQTVTVGWYYNGRYHEIPDMIREDLEQIAHDKVPAGVKTIWVYLP